MATTENFFTGDGLTTSYNLTFEYIDEADVKVSLDGSITTAYSFANATTILFDTAPALDVAIRIYRDTDIDTLKSTFFAGSSIRAQDLNQNFEQNNFAVQELKNYTWDNETDTIHSDETWVSSDTQIATTAAMDQRFQDEAAETIESGETWVSDDDHIATTAAIDARFQDELSETITSSETWPDNDDTIATTAAIDNRIDTAITNDIGTDGTGVTVTDDGDGTITLGLGAGTIDLDRLKASDVITLAEQNASPTTDDDSIFTSSAAAKRFDTIVQTTTPTGTDYEIGKTWLQNDEDKTVSIWNGSAWVAVASGGAFTELGKVVYVDAVNGDDSLAGHRISNPKRTIKAAMDQINAETDAVGNGSMILVAPGIYAEEFPITIQKNDVSIVGTSLRNCVIHPAIGVTAVTAAVNGTQYRIRFVGTTDFTAIGAPDNVVGTVFTATGAGTGTGTLEDTAVQAAYDVDVPEANELSTMFQVNSGTYIQNLTLQGMKAEGTRGGNVLDTDATFGLPTQQGWNFAFFPGATIRKSPYIQNCTNFSDSQINNVNFTPHVPGEGAAGDLDSGGFSGGGILIDGNTVAANSPLRSMVCDSYTHTALNGPGIFVTNNGYTQVTSSYAFFTHYHLKCLNGGQANLAASTSDFGRYSLIADGRSTTNIFTADLTVNAADLATTFTIGQPTADASWHGNATRPQPNMLVQLNGITYPILSSVANGLGWDVTISRPDPANRSNNLGLNGAVNAPATAQFFLRSQIASSGHTMEYVGSGTDYRALPENATGTFPVGANDPVTADATAGNAPCGVPVEDRQTIVLNNGAIWTAVTDHNGKFRVGGDQVNDPTYEVDQQLGRVTFRTGSLSIPNLISNLDTNGFNIFDSTGHVNINDELDVNNNKIVNLAAPTANSDAATKLYVDSQVSVADKIEEFNSSVEVIDTGSNGRIIFTNDGSESARIDPDGRLLIGTSSSTSLLSGVNTRLKLDYTANEFGFQIQRNAGTTAGSGASLLFTRSRATTTEGVTAVSSGDALAYIKFQGTEGTAAQEAARISAVVDSGTVSSTSMPGRLSFSTTADGAVTPTERMRIDSVGRVGINETSPTATLHVAGGTARPALYLHGSDKDIAYNSTLQVGEWNGSTYTERMRIDSSGRLLVNTSTSNTYFGAQLQVEGTTQGNSSIAITRNAGNSGPAAFVFGKTRGTVTDTVANNDGLGDIIWYGADGAAMQQAASIGAYVDGHPGTNDVPGRLSFSTTADGASSVTERWRINNDGELQSINSSELKVDKINNDSGESIIASQHISVYVSDSGNDSTGDGTSSSPWRSLNHALLRAPRLFSSYSYEVRIQGTSYTQPSSVYITGKGGSSDDYYWSSNGITIRADSGTVTLNCNGQGMSFYSIKVPIRFKNIAFVGSSTTNTYNGMDFHDCSRVVVYDTCSWTMNAAISANWTKNNGCAFHRCHSVDWYANITLNSAVTGGYGGLFVFNGCGYVSVSNTSTTKSGTQFGQAAFAVTNGTVFSHGGTINNFHTGIRGGIDHYGAESGGRIIIGGTYTNANTGIWAYHNSHIRTYNPSYSGNGSNIQVDSTSGYN